MPEEAADKRLLWLVSGGLLLASLALWAASRLVWVDIGKGQGVRGADVHAWLVPMALLVLAAVAAALALHGVTRRLLGGLLAAIGVMAIVLTAVFYAGDGTWTTSEPVSNPIGAWTGPTAAILGGILLVGVGVVLATAERRLPRWGGRYSRTGSSRVGSDKEADMWEALDDGEDPTKDE